MGSERAVIRADATRAGLERLRNEIDEWLKCRRAADMYLQYSTQLDTLDTCLHRILQALAEVLGNMPPGNALRDIYQHCHDLDAKLTWTRQVWRYFADKFDQRDDPLLADTLAAADEVVWSCFAGAYSQVPALPRPAAPLPFIDSFYTPNAIPRDQPYVLRNRVIAAPFLQEFLAELPLPVIGLPESCQLGPWWLIFIGHEVGHHLQHDLLPAAGLVAGFRDHLRASTLAAAAGQSPALLASTPAALADRWAAWGEEVFADAVSVHAFGPRASWAMAELILGNDVAMLAERDGKYPPAVVRLALMAKLGAAPEPAGPLALADIDPTDMTTGAALLAQGGAGDLRAAAREHLLLLPGLASAINSYDCGGLGPLRILCRWKETHFSPGGAADDWRDSLLGPNPLALKPGLDAARLVLSGGLAAWDRLGRLAVSDQRAQAEARLAQRLLDAIISSRPEGTRAAKAVPAVADVDARSLTFAKNLLELPSEELGL